MCTPFTVGDCTGRRGSDGFGSIYNAGRLESVLQLRKLFVDSAFSQDFVGFTEDRVELIVKLVVPAVRLH